MMLRKKNRSLCGIYSENEFHALLAHERKRADRTGDQFSILLFDTRNSDGSMDQICLLPDDITDAVRSTDEVGWFDKYRIGVLLVNTSLEGAHRVVEKISEVLVPDRDSVFYQIFTYPTHYFLEKDRLSLGGANPQKFRQIHLFEKETVKADGNDYSFHDGPRESPSKSEAKVSNYEISGLESHLGIGIPLWKRAFDIAFSIAGLFFLIPFLILIAVVIKLVSPGPVFFSQERIGYLGKPFKLLKFRTMKTDTNPAGHEDYVRDLIRSETVMKKRQNESQLIPFGKILRSSGIDEIPQILNVLSGKMSIVGPRPCLPAEFQEYLQWHKRRFYTLPGITGLWQVEGKNRMTFQEMIRKDIAYEQKRSLKMDLNILWKTVPAVMMLMNDA